MAPFRTEDKVISSGLIRADDRPQPAALLAGAERLVSEFSFFSSDVGFREPSRLISCVVCVSIELRRNGTPDDVWVASL